MGGGSSSRCGVHFGEVRGVEEQASEALALFSDIELLAHRKYDPSAHLDRSNTNSFPADYVSALAARAGSYSRGAGAKERVQAGISLFSILVKKILIIIIIIIILLLLLILSLLLLLFIYLSFFLFFSFPHSQARTRVPSTCLCQ